MQQQVGNDVIDEYLDFDLSISLAFHGLPEPL
jgi:hypothetical protein